MREGALKCCPYCQAPARAVGPDHYGFAHVECRKCGAQSPWSMNDDGVAAIKAWNSLNRENQTMDLEEIKREALMAVDDMAARIIGTGKFSDLDVHDIHYEMEECKKRIRRVFGEIVP